jgi:phosphopantetheinyl transferase (holo-ACP synthase)
VLGNDIVDLVVSRKESNWKRVGYLDKIFTKSEQSLIFKAQNPDLMVWNLWSRKEAAYKIYNRQTGIRAYIPLQLECFNWNVINGILYGKVFCNRAIYYTKTEVTDEYIHTIAVIKMDDFDALHYINDTSTIQKINGIPNWINPNTSELKPISISHHGRFTRRVSLI